MKSPPLGARIVELAEAPDLVSLLPADGYAWLREQEGFVAWGEARRLDPGRGPDRFARARELLDELFADIEFEDDPRGGAAPLAIGSFTFDAARPGSVLVVPEVVVEVSDGRAHATVIGEAVPDLDPRFERSQPRLERVRYSGSSLSEVAWLDAVARATSAIERGDLDKVVLGRDVHVWSEAPFDLPAIVGRLALRFPACFAFMVEGLVGASPERLVARSGRRVLSTVLAGSAPRGVDDADDAHYGDALMASAKEVSEHDLAVSSVQEVLESLCEELHLEGPQVLKLANVQHLASDFIGRLRGEESALDIAGRLHPTAAVGGVPRAAALDFITEVEGLDRARYSGPVGWVNAAGDGEWAVALRCAELVGDRGRLFAGAGLVEGSLPEAELEETRLKLRAMESVLGDA